jgi:hypothetical protein
METDSLKKIDCIFRSFMSFDLVYVIFFSFVLFDLVSADYTLHVSGLTFGVLRDIVFSGIWCFSTNPACLLSSRLVALSVWSKVDI